MLRIIDCVVAIFATLTYCIFIWYAGNLFLTLAGDAAAEAPRLSVIAVLPLEIGLDYNMLHWQLLVLASLGAHLVAFRAAAISGMATHYGLLLGLLFLHMSGFATAFTAIGVRLG